VAGQLRVTKYSSQTYYETAKSFEFLGQALLAHVLYALAHFRDLLDDPMVVVAVLAAGVLPLFAIAARR